MNQPQFVNRGSVAGFSRAFWRRTPPTNKLGLVNRGSTLGFTPRLETPSNPSEVVVWLFGVFLFVFLVVWCFFVFLFSSLCRVVGWSVGGGSVGRLVCWWVGRSVGRSLG